MKKRIVQAHLGQLLITVCYQEVISLENIEAQVVKSLDGKDIELYGFIPYLLQDLWEIGASPDVIIDIVQKHIGKSDISVLDLGCGKGAVSVKLAKAVGCNVKGIDALKDFIEYAEDKAVILTKI